MWVRERETKKEKKKKKTGCACPNWVAKIFISHFYSQPKDLFMSLFLLCEYVRSINFISYISYYKILVLLIGLNLAEFTDAMTPKVINIDEDEEIRQTFMAFDSHCKCSLFNNIDLHAVCLLSFLYSHGCQYSVTINRKMLKERSNYISKWLYWYH